MADLSQKKSDTMSRMVDLIPRAMKLAADIKELKSYATDNGFLTGGSNAIVDNDAGTGSNRHLTATSFNDAITALDSLTLNTQNATKLRVASATPIPGGN